MTPTHELISTRGKETNYFVGSEKEVEREKKKLGNDWKFEVKILHKALKTLGKTDIKL